MKVGDYVRIIRANRTYIRKITSIYWINKNEKEKTLILDKSFEGCRYSIKENKVLKSSPNIVDLIEVGDYVDGNRVDFINGNNKLSYEDKCIGFYDGDGDITLFEKDIKSIVTKEQFSSMEYKVH